MFGILSTFLLKFDFKLPSMVFFGEPKFPLPEEE